MHPTLSDQFGVQRSEQERRSQSNQDQMATQPPAETRRLRAEDSWIDIPSRPSSSSLYSQGYNDIVTTGLSVRPGGRQLRLSHAHPSPSKRSTSVAGSSQDEYEESESESDRVMSSSNEDLGQQDEDEDDRTTALGVGPKNVFTPQPNAFSHPPSSGNTRSTPAPDSYFPAIPQTSHSDRLPSNRMITQQTITQRPVRRETSSISRVQPDHDAALRASLTTLLSCAAAVRPSKDREGAIIAPVNRRPVQPTSLRLVPESELDIPVRASKTTTKRRSRESSKERHAKKIRPIKSHSVGEEMLSPTVVTWMISAGVVLVFSAISFSAGYAWGKEVGRIEGEMGFSSGNCSNEALRAGGGLRKLRWGATQSVRA